MNHKLPIVLPDDEGIRPVGRPDECFYCRSKVGEEHQAKCVVVKKKVRVRYTFELDIEVPHHWDGRKIVFHCEYVGVTDSTPIRRTSGEERERERLLNEYLAEKLEKHLCLCQLGRTRF